MAGTEFFPTDVIITDYRAKYAPDEDADRLTRENRLEFLKGYLRNEKLAELVVSLDDAIDARETEPVRDKMFLLRQAHVADLVWISQELKGMIMAHDIPKQRVQTLSSELEKRIAEVME